MRNSSIIRLLFSVVLFLDYGGFAAYFNYYIHSVNREAVSMFFIIHNRAIYAASSALFLKEAIANGNKTLVSTNSSNVILHNVTLIENNGEMFLMDVIRELLTIEKRCNEFQKFGSHAIYGNYLALAARSDTMEFCAISDSYNYSQTLRII